MTKTKNFWAIRQVVVFVLLAFGLVVADPVIAQTETTDDQSRVAQTQEQLTDLVLKSANAIDSFFGNERGVWQQNKTRVTLRGNADWVDDAGWDPSAEVKLYLALPGLNDRLRLVLNDDDDDDTAGSSSDEDESNLALRFVGSLTDRFGIAFDLGVSTRGDPTIQGFARANLFRSWNLFNTQWDARLANRLYWYTDSHWRNDFRWYFERRISDKFFFRSRTRFDYQEDKDSEVYPEQRFTLFQQINDRTALAYEALAREVFTEDSPFFPDDFLVPCQPKCTQYALRLRFRQNVKYPWLFYEIWPTAAWTEARDYEFTPAIRFRLEVVLGDPPKLTRLEE